MKSIDSISRIHSRIFLFLIMVTAVLFAGCQERIIEVTDAKVQVKDHRKGAGAMAQPGQIVEINYHVKTTEGRTVMKDREFRFELGAGAVITGIDEGVVGMRVGGKRTIQCRPSKHWGRNGYGEGDKAIPPNAFLVIELELTDVQ